MFVRQAFAGVPDASIQEAENGLKAQTLLLGSEFDVVLCDWDMPQLSGHELLEWIRSHERNRIKDVPFIMVTSNGEKERVLQAAKAGVSGYIVKPFSAQHLVRQVQNALAKRQVGPAAASERPADTTTRPSACLQFAGRSVKLDVRSIVTKGVTGLVSGSEPVPGILATVVLELALPGGRSQPFSGYVCRIEAAEDSPTPRHLALSIRLTEPSTGQLTFLEEFAAAHKPV
jgi:CheY-like chemotaxis protein